MTNPRDHLQPTNATALEKSISEALARIEDVPVPIRDLWTPERCPPALLPYLADTLAVPIWRVDWPIETQRAVTRAALPMRMRSGTGGTVETALALIGFPSARVHERVRETEPGPAARYDGVQRFDGTTHYDARQIAFSRSWATFRVSLDVADYDRARLSLADLRAVIESYKRAVCWLTDISFRVDAPVEQVAVSDHAAADMGFGVADVWWQGLRYDGTARAVGGSVARYDGARTFDGLGTFDGLAVPEGAPIYRYQAGPYPEAVTAEAALIFFDRHVIPARFDGALRFDGTGHFDGSAAGFRDKGVDLIVMRNGLLAFTGGPYPSVAAPDAALTAGAWGAVNASAAYTAGEF